MKFRSIFFYLKNYIDNYWQNSTILYRIINSVYYTVYTYRQLEKDFNAEQIEEEYRGLRGQFEELEGRR